MPSPICPWPYAARPVIQFEYHGTMLTVYVVFRYPMNMDVIPPLNAWVLRVDGIDKTPAFTSWKDSHCVAFTVMNIPAHPGRVLCTFLGPLDTLKTTWDKQWEPWYRILCIDVPYEWEHILDVDVPNARVTINGTLALTSKTVTPGTYNNLDVSGVNILFLNCAANPIVLQGFTNGIDNQVMQIARISAANNNTTLCHACPPGFQKLFLHAMVDETLNGQFGGWTLVCHNNQWFDISHAKHV